MMPSRILFRLSPLALALVSSFTWATISCSLTTTGMASVYTPSVTTANDNTGSTTLNCTRLATDPTTLTYRLRANNGANSITAPTNRARRALTTNYINYELYTNSTYATVWGATNATQINGSINFGTSTFFSNTLPFNARIPALQTGGTAGSYTDSVTITPRITVSGVNTTLPTVALPVTITTTSSCQFSTPAGPISFSYTAFQTSAATATTTFAARCTSAETYSIALSAPSSVLLGLNYTLAMTTNPGGVAVPSSTTGTGLTGNGLPQIYNINGTIAANQAGTCAIGSCSATQVQTLTITY